MDEQTFSYHGSYHLKDNFIQHNLALSQTYFTGLPLKTKESVKSSPAIRSFPSPNEYREQRRRRFFDRIIAKFSDSKLPGADFAITYLTHQFRRNCKESTLACGSAAIKFFLTFLQHSGKDRLEDTTRHDLEAFVEQLQYKGLKINSVRNRLICIYSFLQFLVDKTGTEGQIFNLDSNTIT
jgi:hypothetical protein